jgi:ActR/RegA family two-component response regulator
MSPLAPALFVLEKSPRWESELKRRMAGRQLLVRPCRSTSDVIALCRQSPGSAVVIDVTGGAADGLRLVEALDRRARNVSAIVIAAREQAELEWPARELGAKAFVSDTIGGAALATLCRRMFVVPASGASSAPPV